MMSNIEIQIIDYLFYHEGEIRKKIREYRLDPPRQRLLIKPSNRILGDPVLNRVIRKMMELRSIVLDDGRVIKKPERCVQMIEKTYEIAGGQLGNVAREKYSGKKSTEIQTKNNINKDKYYRMIAKFRYLAIKIAKDLELL